MSLSVLGSIALDSVETPFGREEDTLGGSATFAALSASFFCSVNILSAVGGDFPEEYLDVLKARDIDVSRVDVLDGSTFRWRARYRHDLDYAHTLDTQVGVFSKYKPSFGEGIPGDNLLLANIDPDLQEWILRKEDTPGIVACDTMGLWIENSKNTLLKLLRKIDLFLLNDAEARQLSGERNLMDAARYLHSKGARMVVIKKGEHGVLFFKDKLEAVIPAYLLENVQDPTGAGDTFAGGMMGYLDKAKGKLNDRLLRRSLVYGSIMASFAVEEFSVKGLLRTDRKALNERYKKFVNLTSF